jgi:hypothetical protein
MRSHLLIRIAAVAVMLAGAAGGTVAAALPAAAIQQCKSYEYQVDYGVTSGSPQSVYTDDIAYCIPGPGSILHPVTIYKYIGGSGWQWVATGNGTVRYTCTGGRYLYSTYVTMLENKPGFYCG